MLQDLQDQIDAPTNAETATTTDKKSNSRHPSLHNKKRQPLRSFSAALLPNQPWTTNQHGVNHHQHHATSSSSSSLLCCHHYRLLYAAIHAVYTQLDLRQCKTLTAEATIMAGLEKELIRYDEMVTPKTYKFGILSVRDDQRAEEQWFGNTGLTRDMETFLEILGHKVELHGYKQYAAGLDTKSGESGTHSYATQWKEHQIMFHVGPLMPFQPQDSQQIHRKRYIGNDIVCIVFMDTDQRGLFDPTAIRSQFVHVFIVVHPETSQGRPAWRVEVVQQQTVASFGPTIPSPPVFVNPRELREFLLLKRNSASFFFFFFFVFCLFWRQI
ncbi:hypothetical protein BC940DRAFT_237945 [Gongronella butleri]|nr:hypothetical protein BC940DRAFT_237945 [Gongronella butleri]